ncbi:hypothetical protein MNBD_CPR01-54, partial [hydrothermal vent metagenome]
NGSGSFSTWETYSTSKTWNLSAVDGTKTVKVRYRDAAGNVSTIASDTITLDTQASSITNVAAVSSSTHVGQNTVASAVITWKTTKPTTSQVDYGFDTNYVHATSENKNLTYSHSVTLKNLSINGSVYHYRVLSTNAYGNQTISTDHTFTTVKVPHGDSKAPSKITDLKVTKITKNSVTLNWSAPSNGFDNHIANSSAKSYDIRYSTNEITSENFTNATKITGAPTPATYDKTNTMQIAGLKQNTTYYIAIRSTDDAKNTSPVSNIIKVTTPNTEIVTHTYSGNGGAIIDSTPPAKPRDFKLTSANNQITLTWENPTDFDFVRVMIFKSLNPIKENTPALNLIQRQDTQKIYDGSNTEYTDAELNNTSTYYYAITAYDRSYNYSKTIVIHGQPLAGKTSIQIKKSVSTSANTNKPTQTTNIHTKTTGNSNPLFTHNLWYRLKNNDVKEMQQILSKNKTLYPEGIVSGYYGKMTVRAVQRFQCAYNIVCEGSPRATGYGVFGPKTRKVFNQINSGSEEAFASHKPIATTPTITNSKQVKNTESHPVPNTQPEKQLNVANKTNTDQIENFTTNLYIGVKNKASNVARLQKILSKDTKIYPEGIISGYFGHLTSR